MQSCKMVYLQRSVVSTAQEKRIVIDGIFDMRFLEVFSGENQSFATECRKRGFDCDTLDCASATHLGYTPTFHGDVYDLVQSGAVKFSHYDGIWLSPPCETWGKVAQSRQCRSRLTLEPMTEKAFHHTHLMHWLLGEALPNQVPWVIENPVGWMKRFFVETGYDTGVSTTKATYCCYGTRFRKPTQFWSNRKLPNLRYCTPKSCPHERPLQRVGKGCNRPSLAETHKIPSQVVCEIMDEIWPTTL